MKKWYIVLLVVLLLVAACILPNISANEGTFQTSTAYIKLSYDKIPTYIEKIDAAEHLKLRQRVSEPDRELLYIESYAPHIRGVLIVVIANSADLVKETPLEFTVSWHNINNNHLLANHPQKELLGDVRILGQLGARSTQSAFIPDFDLVSLGENLEECKMHAEEFLLTIMQVFQ